MTEKEKNWNYRYRPYGNENNSKNKILNITLISLKIQKIHFCFQIMNIMNLIRLTGLEIFANTNIAQFNGLEN